MLSSLLLLAGLATAAEAQEASISTITFSPDPGVMVERYRRLLGIKEGSSPTAQDLEQAEQRLSTAAALEGVELKRVGNRLEVSLKERPVFSLMPVPIP